MSTKDRMVIREMLENARRRAAETLKQRQLAALRQRANILHREFQVMDRQLQSKLRRQLIQLSANKQELVTLQQQVTRGQNALMRADAQVRSAEIHLKQFLVQTNKTAQQIAATTRQFDQAIVIGQKSVQVASQALDQNMSQIKLLGIAFDDILAQDESFRKQLDQLETVDREVQFLMQADDLLVPAAMTLLSMEANNYSLKYTLTKEGMIAYFESEDETHKIAVRAQVETADTQQYETQWELEVETFGLTGPKCLDLLEDFIFEAEETDMGQIELWRRHHPKPDGVKVGLPLPISSSSSEINEDYSWVARRRLRENN